MTTSNDDGAPRPAAPGKTVTVTLPYSEVCCHMRVAGQIRQVRVTAEHMAQILNADGSPCSFPVTLGEAGLRRVEATPCT
jgi:hypothetical protein